MAFGPKSNQKKARVAREIKRFAQKNGLRGRRDLIIGSAESLVPKLLTGWTNHVMRTEQPLQVEKAHLVHLLLTDLTAVLRQRKMTKRARLVVASGVGRQLQRCI